MARDIKGNAVKDYGKEKINTLSAPRSEYPVKSRESEEKHEKPKKHLNDMAGTEVEKAEDTDNNPDARKNPEAFDQHIERMQEHHDRLQMN